ncbi:MAG: GatB/YqeY domain-containing protein [Alistipes onderdonkii]
MRNAKKYIIEAKTAGPEIAELPDADVLKIISKLAKQVPIPPRSSQSRTAPTSRPRSWHRVAVYQSSCPGSLPPEELEAEVRAVIAQVGATSVTQMGKVMGVVTKKLAGRADGKDISAKVRELLS